MMIRLLTGTVISVATFACQSVMANPSRYSQGLRAAAAETSLVIEIRETRRLVAPAPSPRPRYAAAATRQWIV